MPQPLLLSKGVVVKGDGTGAQYQVTRRLGEGQFAECWEVKQCDAGSDLRVSQTKRWKRSKKGLSV